jgi:hypothetical protein
MRQVLEGIRRKEWITVQEAEIVLDLKVGAGYRLAKGAWSAFTKQYEARDIRVHRPTLEELPGEGEIRLAHGSTVQISQLRYRKLQRDVEDLTGEKARLEKIVRGQKNVIRKLIEANEENLLLEAQA